MSEKLNEIQAEIARLQGEHRLREVEPLLRESVELVRKEKGDDSREYVAALNELGSLLRALKELDESEAEFLKAAEIEARGPGHGEPRLRHLHQQPGRYLPAQGRLREGRGVVQGGHGDLRDASWAPSTSSTSAPSTTWAWSTRI